MTPTCKEAINMGCQIWKLIAVLMVFKGYNTLGAWAHVKKFFRNWIKMLKGELNAKTNLFLFESTGIVD